MSKINRRKFLKLGLAGGASFAVGRQLLQTINAGEMITAGKSVSRTTGQLRKAVPSTCLQCPARCGILGFVDDGDRLVKIEGNPKHPNNRGRLCAKGQAGINTEYDPDRILYPMKRVGARGEGKWRRISWDEAYLEMASKLRAIRESGHTEKLVFLAGLDGAKGIVARFLNAFGASTVFSDAALDEANKRVAQEFTWGASIDINDAAHTKYMLNFGANPYETHPLYLSFVQRIIEGRANGAKLVTFDARLSNTAGRSDEWFAIKPGTDGLIALAMANVIMQEGLYDKDFIDKWTNYPADKLTEHLSQYTPQMAEEISSVSASDIARIAVEFATTKPATTISGGGLSKHANGTYNERCVALLCAITGNVDVKGGYCLPKRYEFSEPAPVPPKPTPKIELAHLTEESSPVVHRIAQNALPMFKAGNPMGDVIIAYESNPVYSYPDSNLTAQALKDEKAVSYFVAVDSFLTESAALADLILPCATYLERWGVESVPSYEMTPFVSIRQPIVKPRGEAKPFADVLIKLAKMISSDMERYFDFGTTEDYLRAAISNIDGLAEAGGLDYLKEHGVWFDNTAEANYKSYEKEGFKTPSGKFEIYCERMKERGFNPLPVYEPIKTHQKMKEDELFLVTFEWNIHTDRTANCKWLSEIFHSNPIWIHPETAEARGIKDDDTVKVTSPLGSITTKVHFTEGIHPYVVAISNSLGRWEFGRIAQAKRFKSEDPDTNLLWWEKIGNGVHPHPIIPVAPDPIGGGQAWMDAVVTISKV